MQHGTDNPPCGSFTFDDRGTITWLNDVLRGWLGYDERERLPAKIDDLLTVAGRIFYNTHYFPLLKLTNCADEIFLSFVRKDGGEIPFVTRSVRVHDNHGPLNKVAAIPVVNRRRYEDEILEARHTAEKALWENQELQEAKTALESRTKDLDRRIRQLDSLNHELLQFSHIISNDMQECVRKILVFLNLAHEKPSSKYLEASLRNAQRLNIINENLLVFIQTAVENPEFQKVDLNQLIDTAIADTVKNNGFDGLTVRCDHLPVIDGIAPHLRLLFTNLLNNAITWRRGNNVLVEITHSIFDHNTYNSIEDSYHFAEHIRINVADNGKGFNPDYSEYVFDLLRKLDRDSPGIGIGLPLCKKIVEKHHGSITIVPKIEIGTTVSILLPVMQNSEAPANSTVEAG